MVANRTAGGDELLERLQARKAARATPAPVHRRRAAGGRQRRRAPRRRARAWRRCSTALRADGLLVRRHDRRPRPLHGDDERAASSSASTTSSSRRCPATRSGWLRADLIERVRSATGKPVEHVVVDPTPRERRRPQSHGSRQHRPRRTPRRTSTTARRRPTAARASSPSCSGCCFSSSPRSWSSGPSSRPTSSSGSCPGRPVARATARRCRSRSPASTPRSCVSSSFTMHWARDGDQERQPLRPEGGHPHDLPARLHVPVHPDQRVRRTSASPRRTARRQTIFYSLTGLHGAHVFIGLMLLLMVDDPRLPRPLLARGAPRRRGARASTGTSSTSCGSSCTRRSTCSSVLQPAALRAGGLPRSCCGSSPWWRRSSCSCWSRARCSERYFSDVKLRSQLVE